MNVLKILSSASVIIIIPDSIFAEDNFSVNANIGLTNDYKYYGSTYSNEEWAVSGGFDVAHSSGLYLGTWASTVDFNSSASDPAGVELHIYAGYANKLHNGLGYDIGARNYSYPDQNEDDATEKYNFYEFIASINYVFDGDLTPLLNAGIAISPDYFSDGGNSIYGSCSLTISLPANLGAYVSYGYLDVDDINLSYAHYAVGISREFAGFGMDLSWNDAESECGGAELCRGLVFSITKEF